MKWSDLVQDFFQVSLRDLGKNVQTKLTKATGKLSSGLSEGNIYVCIGETSSFCLFDFIHKSYVFSYHVSRW